VVLICFAVCVAIMAVTWNAAKSFAERRDEEQAKIWGQFAHASVVATGMTVETACRWLQDHEFDVVMWDPHKERGWLGQGHSDYVRKRSDYLVIWATRRQSRGGIFSTPSWIDLELEFTLDGRFTNAHAKLRRYSLPASTQYKARSAAN
jgi:hypothetical protein